jgi:hypothetical protein
VLTVRPLVDWLAATMLAVVWARCKVEEKMRVKAGLFSAR